MAVVFWTGRAVCRGGWSRSGASLWLGSLRSAAWQRTEQRLEHATVHVRQAAVAGRAGMDLLQERAALTAAGLPTFEPDEIETLRQEQVHVYRCALSDSGTDALCVSHASTACSPDGCSEDHSTKSTSGTALVTTSRILWISGREAGAVRLQHVVRTETEVRSPVLSSPTPPVPPSATASLGHPH